MNSILLVVSTEFEIQTFLQNLCIQADHYVYDVKSKPCVNVLITGMGIANMTLRLSRYFSTHNVSQAVNIGFCGSFDHHIELGNHVLVESDVFAELGVLNEHNDIMTFDKLTENQNILENLNMFVKPDLVTDYDVSGFQTVKGITVSSCTNNHFRSELMQKKFSAQVESMEGAAFFMTCNEYQISCAQIRTVSNHIPGRQPDKWNIRKAEKAVSELAEQLCQFGT